MRVQAYVSATATSRYPVKTGIAPNLSGLDCSDYQDFHAHVASYTRDIADHSLRDLDGTQVFGIILDPLPDLGFARIGEL